MKITIIGGGNAGVWTALHYGYHTRNIEDIEVELVYDPEIESFPVGQGATLDVVQLLWFACGTDWYHNKVRATPKLGILYENFSKKNKNIYHNFPFDSLTMQADPKYLQKYILNSKWFRVIEGNITDLDMVDADVIFDCRGNTKKDDIEYKSLYCPVNSVLLAISTMHDNVQNWTRSVATPDGWTFIIPNTTDTTSYGYLYNKDITSLENAKTNFSKLFNKEFPNEMETFNLPFESYIAKEPVRVDSKGRKIILSGNRLAFLEPMEATAVGFYLDVAKYTFNWITVRDPSLSRAAALAKDAFSIKDIHININKMLHDIHTFILWHYIKGSIYDTPFWKKAQAETTAIFEEPNENFQNFVKLARSISYMDCRYLQTEEHYGQWPINSIKLWYDKYIK